MSKKLIDLVWEQSPCRGSKLTTLLYIALNADDDGNIRHPLNVADIAKAIRMTERQALNILKSLRTSGYINIQPIASKNNPKVSKIDANAIPGSKGDGRRDR